MRARAQSHEKVSRVYEWTTGRAAEDKFGELSCWLTRQETDLRLLSGGSR